MITDIIRQRKSVRTFDGRPLSAEDFSALEDYMAALTNPFSVPITFRLLDAKEHGLSSPVILGENTYLAAKVKKVPNYEIAYGYSFEKVCLYALSRGIGTVMLAASLSRAAFEKAMEEEGVKGTYSFSDPGIPTPDNTHYIVTFGKA